MYKNLYITYNDLYTLKRIVTKFNKRGIKKIMEYAQDLSKIDEYKSQDEVKMTAKVKMNFD